MNLMGPLSFLVGTALPTFLFWAGPGLLEACPRCVDATPYKMGMQLAVLVLLPLPLALGGWLLWTIRKYSRPQQGEDLPQPPVE